MAALLSRIGVIMSFLLAVEFAQASGDHLPKIQVEVGASTKSLKGLPWSTLPTGRLSGMTAYEKPCEVTIRFEQGGTFATRANLLTMMQNGGIVTFVGVIPQFELLAFDKAVTKAEQIAETLKVHDTELVRERLQCWKQQASDPKYKPELFSHITGADLGRSVSVNLELKYHEEKKGWYVAVDFSKIDPALRSGQEMEFHR